MKICDIFEARTSKEELEAAKNLQPDYWKKGIRKEFNDILKKFGATSKETSGRYQGSHYIFFDREVNVSVSGEGDITIHRDKRAAGIILAVAKWLHGLLGRDFHVKILQHGDSKKPLDKSATLEEIHTQLKQQVGLERWIARMQRIPNGDQKPLRFDLRFLVRTIPFD